MKIKSGNNLKKNDLLLLQAPVNGLVLKGAAVGFKMSSTIETASVEYEIDTETLTDKCILTVKTKLKIKIGEKIIEKLMSNTVEVDDETFVKEFRRQSNNQEIIFKK